MESAGCWRNRVLFILGCELGRFGELRSENKSTATRKITTDFRWYLSDFVRDSTVRGQNALPNVGFNKLRSENLSSKHAIRSKVWEVTATRLRTCCSQIQKKDMSCPLTQTVKTFWTTSDISALLFFFFCSPFTHSPAAVRTLPFNYLLLRNSRRAGEERVTLS